MAKFIKKFETEQQYEEYLGSSEYVEPHCSYIEDGGNVHYNMQDFNAETK